MPSQAEADAQATLDKPERTRECRVREREQRSTMSLRTGLRAGMRQMSGVCNNECMDACMSDGNSREYCEMQRCEVW